MCCACYAAEGLLPFTSSLPKITTQKRLGKVAYGRLTCSMRMRAMGIWDEYTTSNGNILLSFDVICRQAYSVRFRATCRFR